VMLVSSHVTSMPLVFAARGFLGAESRCCLPAATASSSASPYFNVSCVDYYQGLVYTYRI
jgi:hypothetical protein